MPALMITPPLWFASAADTQRYPRLEENHTTDVAVIGGGITGVSAAYVLARAGCAVTLLEAGHLGTGETGYTTAFLTSSVDTPFAVLRERFDDTHVRTIRDVGEAALTAVERIIIEETLDCGFSRVDAIALGFTKGSDRILADEAAAITRAGGETELLASDAIHFTTRAAAHGALRIPRQGLFHVRHYLIALAERIAQRGGNIFEKTRVTNIEAGDRVTLSTATGTVTADHVVVATGLFPRPFAHLNELLRPSVTYVVALTSASQDGHTLLPKAILWDVAHPFHYMRPIDSHVCVGGEDRPPRDASSAGDAPWAALDTYARSILPNVPWERTHAWRGQILETADALPLVGPAPGIDQRILFASGFGGNGMTFGTAAAETITALIMGTRGPQDNPFRFERETLGKL